MPDSVRPLCLDVCLTVLTCRIWDGCLWAADQPYLTPWAQVSKEWRTKVALYWWHQQVWPVGSSHVEQEECEKVHRVNRGCHFRHQKCIPTPRVLGKSSSMPALKGLCGVIGMFFVINAYSHKYRSVYSSIWKLQKILKAVQRKMSQTLLKVTNISRQFSASLADAECSGYHFVQRSTWQRCFIIWLFSTVSLPSSSICCTVWWRVGNLCDGQWETEMETMEIVKHSNVEKIQTYCF